MDSKNKYLEGAALQSNSTNELSSPFVDEVFFNSQLLDLESPHSSYQVLEQENTIPFDNEELELENSEIFDEAESYLEDEDEFETEDDFIDLSGEETEEGDSFTDELADEIELLEDNEFEEYDDYLDEEENSYQEWEALGEDDSDFSQEEIYETDELGTEDAEVEDVFELYNDEAEVEFAEEESDVGLFLEEKYDEDYYYEHDQGDYNDETEFDDEKDYRVDYNTRSSQEVWSFENIEGIPNTAQSLIHNIVKIANNEYANWNKGKLQETNDGAKKYLERYWGTVVDSKGINWRIRQQRPWSAAFISYVVNKAGGHPPFKLSRAHIAYARVAKRNRARNKLEEPISMWFYKIQEIKPQVGDILFRSRIQRNKDKTIDRKRTGANYDNIANGNDWATHSDIVVDVDESKGCIYVIGGNVKQSVFKRKQDLDRNGYVKLIGRKLNDFFGILRFFDPNVGASSSINTLKNTRSNTPSKNHYPTIKSAPAPSSYLMNSLIHKGKKTYLYGKAFYLATVAISNGEKKAATITDKIFHDLYPDKKGKKLSRKDPLVKNWKYILNVIVSPMLKNVARVGDNRPDKASPNHKHTLGTLVFNGEVDRKSRNISYTFSHEDLLMLAKLLIGEAGQKGGKEHAAIAFCMINNFAFIRYGNLENTFWEFLQKYSTTLQPVFNAVGAAKRHYKRPDYVIPKSGVYYKNSKPLIPKGQIRKHLKLQKKEWGDIPEKVQKITLGVLKGTIQNPGIGIATKFSNTTIYWRQRKAKATNRRWRDVRVPTLEEWKTFNWGRKKTNKRIWIGPVDGLTQYRTNSFFIEPRFRNIDPDSLKIEGGSFNDD